MIFPLMGTSTCFQTMFKVFGGTHIYSGLGLHLLSANADVSEAKHTKFGHFILENN